MGDELVMGDERSAAGDRRRTAHRTCPLCEATCGLEIDLDGDEVVRIRGDRADVFSHGFICPKGSTLHRLSTDPDRLRRPMVRRDGIFVETDWDDAFAEIERRLAPIVAEHGRDALAAYVGNPNAHNLSAMLFLRPVLSALGSRNRFSAGSVDQRPKEVSTALMFGSVLIPVPDLDRSDLVVLMGANPYASNGSICTAPDFPGRLEALRARGATLVVVDPVRTRTAAEADVHLPIRPGTDAHLLAAVIVATHESGAIDLGHLAEHVVGVDDVVAALAPFTPEAVAPVCGVAPEAIWDLARRVSEAPSAAFYGRIGTCVQTFGTTASWLVDVCNALTGNLDRVGGAMFATGATGQPSTRGEPGTGRGVRLGRWASRVNDRPEAMGELPVAALAEDITSPGEGQIRVLVTLAGNPARSLPNSDAIDEALGQLELMISVDPYLNETTRHADVILPPPPPLERSHYDVLLYNFAVRNVANYSPPVVALGDGALDEWQILLRLADALALRGTGAADPDAQVEAQVAQMVRAAVADEWSPVAGRDPDELLAASEGRRGPERVLDHLLRTGPFGDAYGARPDGLSLARLEEAPHGVDLGPLEAGRLPDALRTPSGKIELAPAELMADIDRLVESLDRSSPGGDAPDADAAAGDTPDTDAAAGDGPDAELALIGRRHLRSNNSWMHNIDVLVSGRDRCTLWVHPTDAARAGVEDGSAACVRSRVGEVVAPVEVTDAVRPGVVSLPHGWGHDAPGAQLSVASRRPGVNANRLTDEAELDPVSGTSVLNGVPVTLTPA